MEIKNSLGAIIGWASLTVLAVAVALFRIVRHNPYHIAVIIAVLMIIILVYVFILRRIDGPLYMNSLNDERLRHISNKAQRNSFWFLFMSIWSMAAVLEFFDPYLLREYISLALAAIGTAGLFIYMLSFVWQKYKV